MDIGLTQGVPLFPTIFDVVVDIVVCHWGSLMEKLADRDDSIGNEASQPEIWTIRARDNR